MMIVVETFTPRWKRETLHMKIIKVDFDGCLPHENYCCLVRKKILEINIKV